MKRSIFCALVALSTFNFQFSTAQRASVAFWNVENLFDTIPSPFYDDRQWTPRGANRWDTARYRAKIEALAGVIDRLGADIVGLAEVENEGVVRDLVRALRTDYNYIHRTSGDSRGIDQALLYKGDRFFPDSGPDGRAGALIASGTGREFLHVKGELAGEAGDSGGRVEFIVCHMTSNLNSAASRRRNMEALRGAVERILGADPGAAVVVMGDMNATPGERIVRGVFGRLDDPWNFVHSPHAEIARRGSYSYRGRWLMYDWMMVSRGVGVGEAGIHASADMTELDQRYPGRHRPRRTFAGGDYKGGASDHFPVWITLAGR